MTGPESLLEILTRGRALPEESGRALQRLLGVRPGLEGLSRLFQPRFHGVRAFVIAVHEASDQAVDMTLVGISRTGRPVWTGSRAFVPGRDGSLEIHRGFDTIDPEYQSRNITVDVIQRELDLLALVSRGKSGRLTLDAEGIGKYVFALHGFVFADESEDGPSTRSSRPLEPTPDRTRLLESAKPILSRLAEERGLGKIAIESALEEAARCRVPWDFARLHFGDAPPKPSSPDAELGVGDVGRELLLNQETPSWRGALFLSGPHRETFARGAEYRRQKTLRSEARLAEEIASARQQLTSFHRATRLKALRRLGLVGPDWLASEIKELTEEPDRRVAAQARQTLGQLTGQDLPELILAFARDARGDLGLRALACRVLAEHYPERIAPDVELLRVHPDARLQRAVIPILAAQSPDGPELASMLYANPRRNGEADRPGLAALRLELIERLRRRASPNTLPALMEAFRADPPPDPAERLALSRALLAFGDPRAQTVLMEAAERLPRPEIP